MNPFKALLLAFLLLASPALAESVDGKPYNLVRGGTLSLDSLKGKVVVVNFWATWCPPCRDEIPDLNAVQKQFGDKGLQVVGVNFMDNLDQKGLAEFMDEFEFIYPVIFGKKSEMRDLAQYLGGAMGLPTTFFLDRQGKVTYIHTGALDKGQMVKILNPMVGK